jgi:carbon-monoxide dehydrogenase small subunit
MSSAARESWDVRLTVNGNPVTLTVPARVTLADTLRDRLGLTGTHLGCEHGVCGMCTVLVDGDAARSCLLFAVQLDGAEIVTVEGLGRPDAQHPLQEAFSRHHALQCGFCTPGFLMSSYDLLADGTDVEPASLPAELSGVLCRCTGYRNIIAAVADVADAHPDGIPGPRNCGAHALADRGRAVSPGIGGVPPADGGDAAPAGDTGAHEDIRLPAGRPAATVDVASQVAAPLAEVWRVLDDIDLLARCLPGAELTERLPGDRYRGRARVAVGPIRLSFAGFAQVTERDPGAHRLHVLAHGTDAGGAQTHADIRLTAEAVGEGTTLRAQADVYLAGRIAQFGRALAGDVSRRLFEQFAEAVAAAAIAGPGSDTDATHASSRPAVAVRPMRLMGAVAAARLRALVRRVRSAVGR